MKFVASPTGERLLRSRAYIKGIMGPVGGGKSTLALFDLLSRAVGQEPFNGVRRTKFGVLRNTSAQLRSTVKPLMDEWFVQMQSGGLGQWTQTQGVLAFEARFRMPDGTRVESDFMLVAADTPDDVRRLLSLQLSAAWVEEAREVDPEVFGGLLGRVDRYPSRVAGGVTYPGVVFSTNPPPIGGFWHDLITNPPKNAEIFIQPPALLPNGQINPEAENLAHLGEDYYNNLIEANTAEWAAVYLRNEFGQGNAGKPIYRASFRKDFHVAKDHLIAVPQSVNPLVIGMDNGLQAAAVVMQQDLTGRVNLLSECYVEEDDSMGVESFLDRLLLPHLRNRYPSFKPESVLFVLDPACFQRSQVNAKTIAMAVQERGYRPVMAITNDPERRIQAVEDLLVRQIDGQAGMLIDPRCEHIIRALEWGYRYKKTTTGATAGIDKNHAANVADAHQYACLHFNPFTAQLQRRTPRRDVKKAAYVYAHA